MLFSLLIIWIVHFNVRHWRLMINLGNRIKFYGSLDRKRLLKKSKISFMNNIKPSSLNNVVLSQLKTEGIIPWDYFLWWVKFYQEKMHFTLSEAYVRSTKVQRSISHSSELFGHCHVIASVTFQVPNVSNLQQGDWRLETTNNLCHQISTSCI